MIRTGPIELTEEIAVQAGLEHDNISSECNNNVIVHVKHVKPDPMQVQSEVLKNIICKYFCWL